MPHIYGSYEVYKQVYLEVYIEKPYHLKLLTIFTICNRLHLNKRLSDIC